MKRLYLILTVASLGVAQTVVPTTAPFQAAEISTPSSPSSGYVKIYGKSGKVCAVDSAGAETCSGNATFSDVTDLKLVRTSATVITIGAATSTKTTQVGFGGKVNSFSSAPTATVTSGSGTAYFYVTRAGVITVGIPGAGMAVTCSGCTTTTGVTAFPDGAYRIGTWDAASVVWATTGTDLRSPFNRGLEVVAGTGISTTVDESTGTVTVAASGSKAAREYTFFGAGVSSGGTTSIPGGVWLGDGTVDVTANNLTTWPWRFAYLIFPAKAATASTANFGVPIPLNWDGGTVRLDLHWLPGSGASSGNIGRFYVSTVCSGAGDATWSSAGPTFNTPAQNADGTLGASPDSKTVISTLTSLTMTGCDAGETLVLQVSRGVTGDPVDTLTQTMNLIRGTVKFLTTLE